MSEIKQETAGTGLEVAVIGMAGRFPGARNLDEFWENLKNGIDAVSFFSDKELDETGVSPVLLKNPNYVKAKSSLDDIEYFDASFFDYTPREAAVMDPQMRIFHECAFHALEDAGYDPYSFEKLIGCYAGASVNFYWQVLAFLSAERDGGGLFEARQLSDKEYLCTRLAHKLNLRGPAVSLQSACSTSLVAIHMACQGLISGECDLALAGGVSIPNLRKEGYLYKEGMIFSPDGHCRAFDARSVGAVYGNGVGAVVLKRLEEAAADSDHIYAVIKGSFINNDGINRGGFTAPSTEGQAAVIRTALQVAEVEPESIGYVEAHGTGTVLGDPIEVEGLKLAFGTGKKAFCAIGTVKTNVGHLNIAAGVAGFIKTVLALKHGLIPPSLHFEIPNPVIDFEHSPVYVNTKLSPWQNDRYPRRAGVSSFGIGGTNAHLVLEEWPGSASSISRTRGRPCHLILVSANSAPALERATGNLAEYLKKNRRLPLADVSYTLTVGRRWLAHRRMLVCHDADEAIEKLSCPDSGKVHSFCAKDQRKPVIFMFAGLGSQYVNMGKDLYLEEPLFQEEMDRCFDILKPLGYDIKGVLYPDLAQPTGKAEIDRFEIAQLVVFAFEYALAKLLMKWGITPCAMIGYSFGEYTAACTAGVLSLADALKMIICRGRLIEKIRPGIMLSVPLTREELLPFLGNYPELSLAIDNGPSCIVAGADEVVNAFEKEMKKNRQICMRLQGTRALHSKMMAPILREFGETIAREITLNQPRIPYISNVTGRWLNSADLAEPAYWAKHLSETVRFSDGIRELMNLESSVFVEIGPGRDLSTLLVRYLEDKPGSKTINLVRPQEQNLSDTYVLLNRIGRLRLWGVQIDWAQFFSGEKRCRVSLPPYPFERRPFPIGGGLNEKLAALLSQPSLTDERSQQFAGGVLDESVLAERFEEPPISEPIISRRPDLETEYTGPGNDIEQRMTHIWAHFFGFERIGIDDDFFELGGDSLKALIVITKIHKEMQVELAVNEFFKRPTIRKLALLMADKGRGKQQLLNQLGGIAGPAVKLKQPGIDSAEIERDLKKYVQQPVTLLSDATDNDTLPRKKLFCFPPALAFGIAYKKLSLEMSDYSLYSFNFLEDDDRLKRYVEIITGCQPVGPYLLFGFSAAGRLTFEVAKALENHGFQVADIILVDTFRPGQDMAGEVPAGDYNHIEKYLEDLGVGFLKEEILGKTRKYRSYFNEQTNLESVNADVHLILSEENRDAPLAGYWIKLTSKTSRIYHGFGTHEEMLYTPENLEKNARIIRQILGNS